MECTPTRVCGCLHMGDVSIHESKKSGASREALRFLVAALRHRNIQNHAPVHYWRFVQSVLCDLMFEKFASGTHAQESVNKDLGQFVTPPKMFEACGAGLHNRGSSGTTYSCHHHPRTGAGFSFNHQWAPPMTTLSTPHPTSNDTTNASATNIHHSCKTMVLREKFALLPNRTAQHLSSFLCSSAPVNFS